MLKKSTAQPVENSWKSKKPVKKVSKTPKATKKSIKDDYRIEKEKGETRNEITGGVVVVMDKWEPTFAEVVQKPVLKYNLWSGRPTKYREEYADMLIDFCSSFSQEVYIDREYYDIKGKTRDETIARTPVDEDGYKRHLIKRETHKVITSTFPTMQRFAHLIDVHYDTLHEWAHATYDEDYKIVNMRGKKKYPRFSEAYMRAKQMQESILIENAMNWNFNPQFAMFFAKNCFGYKDKTEVEQTTTWMIGIVWLSEEKKESLKTVIARRQWKIIELQQPSK